MVGKWLVTGVEGIGPTGWKISHRQLNIPLYRHYVVFVHDPLAENTSPHQNLELAILYLSPVCIVFCLDNYFDAAGHGDYMYHTRMTALTVC